MLLPLKASLCLLCLGNDRPQLIAQALTTEIDYKWKNRNDMKIIVLGDIHGRTGWKKIIDKEQPDQVIFLGDYVSPHDCVSESDQVSNLLEIMRFKDHHPETIMLRGNHDMQHLDYDWAQCSGYFQRVAELMVDLKEEFLEKTQWIHVMGNTVFSHAGISRKWLAANKLTLDGINASPPSEPFGFNLSDSWDVYGTSPLQPPTWIRPKTLVNVMIPGYDQVVGHTEVEHCFNVKDSNEIPHNLWLCDALDNGSYLVIENNEFYENKLN